jgi:diguanylate cyclase (GGDEF)-like protein/PAS domain S-box-containing protein
MDEVPPDPRSTVSSSDDVSSHTGRSTADGRFLAGAEGGPAEAGHRSEIEGRYRALIDHLPAVLYIDGAAAGTPMLDVSPRIHDLLGITPAEWIERHDQWEERVHPDDRDHVVRACERSIETGDPFRVEYRGLHSNGDVVWIREEAVLIRDADGAPRYWLGIMMDQSELIQAQVGLRDARSKYGALVEQIPAIVYVDVADDSMTSTYVSPQIEGILGVSPERYLAEPDLWTSMLHPDDRARALETYLRGRRSGEPFAFEYRLVAPDGRVVWFQDSAIVLKDEDGTPTFVQGVMLDVSERKRAEESLAFLAYHDELTSLPNKAMFDELLELAIARADRTEHGVAVLALDVDNFKLVNDSLGHREGDRLIAALADRLRGVTRDTDLLARQGGDEFLLLLADLDPAPGFGGRDGVTLAAAHVAQRVQEMLRSPFELNGTELYATVSIGISLYPADATDPGQLLRNADAAMFRAKQSGPGGYVVHRADDTDARTKLSLSTRLRKAVDQQSWMLHYQPLIDLASGDMYGVEALIRWPDPTGTLVPPGEFIPLAEEMGLIDAIGGWVVDEIGRQDAAWRDEGIALEVGFNLSPRQLWQDDPVGRIARQIRDAGMDPGRVTVEITESTAMTDPDRTLRVLHGFKDEGFQLAIDDFGTGYSSLSRLRYMPVDVLKIDRTFIREVHSDAQSASMVSAIIALANNLGMQPLAEGIETEAEWRFLADRGCPFGQGFLFSRPVPADQITAMHRRAGLHVVEGGLAI